MALVIGEIWNEKFRFLRTEIINYSLRGIKLKRPSLRLRENMGADWGPIFSGIIIAICLIIAIPFIDVEESDGTYKEEILQDSFSKNISYCYRKAIF